MAQGTARDDGTDEVVHVLCDGSPAAIHLIDGIPERLWPRSMPFMFEFQLTVSAAHTETTEYSQPVLMMIVSTGPFRWPNWPPGPAKKIASIPFRGNRLSCGPSRTLCAYLGSRFT